MAGGEAMAELEAEIAPIWTTNERDK